MDDWKSIALLLVICLVAVLLFVAVAVYMAKIIEWIGRWAERLEKMPLRRRIAMTLFLLPAVLAFFWLQWVGMTDRPSSSPRLRMAELRSQLETTADEMMVLLRKELYESWKLCSTESQKAEFRRAMATLGRDDADFVWGAFENADDPTYKSDLAYVLQQLLNVDAGVTEGEELSNERLQEVEKLLRAKLDAEPDP